MSDATPPTASHAPLSTGAFVALMLMGLNAGATDAMLPALPQIAADLGAVAANDRQAPVTAYLVGFGLGQFAMGPLSDRYGRRPVLLWGLAAYLVAGAACVFAGDFGWLLAARAAQGLGAAAPRVVVSAVVRDCYAGRAMARVTSLAMMAFMAAPVLAPALGQAILLASDWRGIFAGLAIYGALALACVALLLPETLPVARRRRIDPRGLRDSVALVLRSRQTVGYAAASGVFFGALFGFINSAQQILGELYGLGTWFPAAFGAIAAAISLSSAVNAALVARWGMRALSHGAVAGFTAASLALVALSLDGAPPLWAFLALIGGAMTLVGMVFANFNALAMEPQAEAAGVASSLIGGATTLIGASAGFWIGRAYDGTPLPLAAGYAACGLATLALLALTERGRLFRAEAAG
jgi:DHA1 family bicyclomycin/chloramphenicol resistance-like MFS transporter